MKKLLFILSLFSLIFVAKAQEISKVSPDDKPDMTWFNEAKLGIFVVWGIYSVNGIAESWSFITMKYHTQII